jgi:hypothetical protein
LARKQGTLDLEEAIRREIAGDDMRGDTKHEILSNTVEEMKHMQTTCATCNRDFDYDGRKHRKPPEKCSECGGPEGSILLAFDPKPPRVRLKDGVERKKITVEPTEDPRPTPEDYRPPIETNPLLMAFDAFQAACRKVFIERQNQHGKDSILDVTLEDLVGVHRLKGARIKQQIKTGVKHPEVLHDSLIDNAVYCFILEAVATGAWESLDWRDVA